MRESNHVPGLGSYTGRLEATAKHLQKVRDNEKKQRIDKWKGRMGNDREAYRWLRDNTPALHHEMEYDGESRRAEPGPPPYPQPLA